MPSKSNKDTTMGELCCLCQDQCSKDDDQRKAKCGHVFHRDCAAEYLEEAPRMESGKVGCPVCFKPLTIDIGVDIKADDENESRFSCVHCYRCFIFIFGRNSFSNSFPRSSSVSTPTSKPAAVSTTSTSVHKTTGTGTRQPGPWH